MPPRIPYARIATAWLLAAMLGGCASAGTHEPATDASIAIAATPAAAANATTDAVAATAPGNPPVVGGSIGRSVVPAATADDASSPNPADAAAGNARADAVADDTPTQAEDDFTAIYGGDAGATAPGARNPMDPWEPFNRRVHHFNNGVDRTIAKPLARGYIAIAPPPVRLGIGNFFSNLGQPVSALNALLQGHPRQAGQSLARFSVNFTFGVLGFFDPATHLGLANRSEDFGQTLARWGWKRSRYLELPFFGPRTLRDAVGGVVEAPLSPLGQIEEDRVRVFLQGLQLVDLRTNLLAADSMREGAYDDYSLTRDAWLQRRNYQIDGDGGNAAAPPYLLDDAPVEPATSPAQ